MAMGHIHMSTECTNKPEHTDKQDTGQARFVSELWLLETTQILVRKPLHNLSRIIDHVAIQGTASTAFSAVQKTGCLNELLISWWGS